MRIHRPVIAALAMIVTLASSSQAAEESVLTAPSVQAASADSSLKVAQTYEQIRSDIGKAEFTSETMLQRIDQLIARIDRLMKIEDENRSPLLLMRESALKMRASVARFAANNGTRLVQVTADIPPVGQLMPGTEIPSAGGVDSTILPDGTVIEGGTLGSGGSLGSGAMGGTGSSGGIGGTGSGGGLGAGGGGLASLGAIAAAVTAVATSDDDDNPGTPASPSEL